MDMTGMQTVDIQLKQKKGKKDRGIGHAKDDREQSAVSSEASRCSRHAVRCSRHAA
jgi:hypothetical protein